MNQAGSPSSPVAVGLSLTSMLNTEYCENFRFARLTLALTLELI